MHPLDSQQSLELSSHTGRVTRLLTCQGWCTAIVTLGLCSQKNQPRDHLLGQGAQLSSTELSWFSPHQNLAALMGFSWPVLSAKTWNVTLLSRFWSKHCCKQSSALALFRILPCSPACPHLPAPAPGCPWLQSSRCAPRCAWSFISHLSTTAFGALSTLGGSSLRSEQTLFFTDL